MKPSKHAPARLTFIVAACLGAGAWNSARAIDIIPTDIMVGLPANSFNSLLPSNIAKFNYLIVLSPGEDIGPGYTLEIKYDFVLEGGNGPDTDLPHNPFLYNFPDNSGPACDPIDGPDPSNPVKCADPLFIPVPNATVIPNGDGSFTYIFKYKRAEFPFNQPIRVPPGGLMLGYFATLFGGARITDPPFFFVNAPRVTVYDAQGNPRFSSPPPGDVAGGPGR